MHKRQNTKICWPFHYGKKSIFSDFQKNHTTDVPVSLFMEFKSAGIFSIPCFVSKLEGKLWFSNYFLTVHMCKTSYNKDKVVLFFPPERWVHGQTHPKIWEQSYDYFSVAAACLQKKLKKFENSVGFSTSRSETVKPL